MNKYKFFKIKNKDYFIKASFLFFTINFAIINKLNKVFY